MRPLRPATAETGKKIDKALNLMREARSLLREADAVRACEKLQRAINSTEGARRHSERRPIEKDPTQ